MSLGAAARAEPAAGATAAAFIKVRLVSIGIGILLPSLS
jgi:hypothetical protein